MKNRSEIIVRLTEPGVIAVVRTGKRHQVLPLARALLDGGISAIEITMTTPGALEAIAEARQNLGPTALIGVGSVLDAATCQQAIAAGAEFVVSPIGKVELVAAAHSAEKPVMLGAYTPTEAQRVHETGADFVKLFPADSLGPAYIKALRAPLPHLRIVPTGGVILNNIAEFLKAGCAAVGVGSSLMTKEILSSENWGELTARAHEFVAAARAARVKL